MLKEAYEAGVYQAMIDSGLTKEAGLPRALVTGAGLGAGIGALAADDPAEGALKGLGIGAGIAGGANVGRRIGKRLAGGSETIEKIIEKLKKYYDPFRGFSAIGPGPRRPIPSAPTSEEMRTLKKFLGASLAGTAAGGVGGGLLGNTATD